MTNYNETNKKFKTKNLNKSRYQISLYGKEFEVPLIQNFQSNSGSKVHLISNTMIEPIFVVI